MSAPVSGSTPQPTSRPEMPELDDPMLMSMMIQAEDSAISASLDFAEDNPTH